MACTSISNFAHRVHRIPGGASGSRAEQIFYWIIFVFATFMFIISAAANIGGGTVTSVSVAHAPHLLHNVAYNN